MEILDAISLGLLVILFGILLNLAMRNSKLAEEKQHLQEILALKNSTINNYEASRIAVVDVIENFGLREGVMQLLERGESREAVAGQLGLTIQRIETIIKLDAYIQKNH